MNYLEVRNSECDYIINEFIKFDEEIMTDLKNVLNKIQNKNLFFKELFLKNEENSGNEINKQDKNVEEEKDNINNIEFNNNKNEENENDLNDLNDNINIEEIKKNNGFFENKNDINNLNNIDNTNKINYIHNNDLINNTKNILSDNDNNGIYNSLEVSLLSNQDEVNVHQYIDATFDANANEHEILLNESPEKLSNDSSNNNNYILDEPNTLINKDNNYQNNLNNNNPDMKMVKSQSSCGFNENIEEYGEGGNSLIRKINNLNKKEFNTIQVKNNEPKNNNNINNINNINITGKIFLNKNNSTDKIYLNPKIHNKYIMKRKLLKEIYIYNIKEKRLESIKDFKKDQNLFKRFFQFSIYLNAKNNLYISGGKTKEEQISNSFYCYNYEQNTLTVLPEMINPRCSHSMIYINNHIINDELFIIGGHGINTGERYSFRTQKWKLLPCLHTKERQVPTLICYGDYLYTIFGFVNGKKNSYILGEKINLNKLEKWEMINVKYNGIDEEKLNKFNVGVIKLSNDSFLIVGGEINTGGETDDVFKLDFKGNDEIVISETNLKLPCPASFIDKNFIPLDQKKFAQFDMKKSNFIFYDMLTNKFGMKPMMKKK